MASTQALKLSSDDPPAYRAMVMPSGSATPSISPPSGLCPTTRAMERRTLPGSSPPTRENRPDTDSGEVRFVGFPRRMRDNVFDVVRAGTQWRPDRPASKGTANFPSGLTITTLLTFCELVRRGLVSRREGSACGSHLPCYRVGKAHTLHMAMLIYRVQAHDCFKLLCQPPVDVRYHLRVYQNRVQMIFVARAY